ncbi:MAG: D-glycero-beta-D-manno-heptose-7-phosphate kinase [Deltaproteobacteria bacterium]|nr:D-glycero-beta-D-manno-heptose-7-phosphate kinase [Deltaproteobacteria bacterium]
MREKKKNLKEFIDRFTNARVLVIGDIILDEYIWGDVSRISPEAPVPVVEIIKDEKRPGGAANVVYNILSLKGQADLCGAVGDDIYGRNIRDIFEGLGRQTDGIITDPGRCTSIKTRILGHNQQMIRIDREKRYSVGDDTTQKILGFLEGRMNNIDALIISDYGKGMITSSLMEGVKSLKTRGNIIICVDPRPDNFRYYHGTDVITPNHHEAEAFCGFRIKDEESLNRAGRKILDDLNCRTVLITRGKDGMTLFQNNSLPLPIPTVARNVFDVSGAGDTVIAVFCLGLASGMDTATAAMISNLAAGIVVGKVGTSVANIDELKKAVDEYESP